MTNRIGETFDVHHAAGVTRYRVARPHRDAGYFECVAVAGLSGSHHFIGSIEIFSRDAIETYRAPRNSYGTAYGCETHNKQHCDRCGAVKPIAQSCACFDNGCQ